MMNRRTKLGLVVALLACLAVAPAAAQDDTPPRVYRVAVEGPLTPVWITYLERSIEAAEREKAEALLVVLNTPGGQINLMQRIVEIIRASQVPVIVYVSPRGAAAASAGTLITLAAHVAAMAPETTIGAASPVGDQGQDIGETLERKIKEDIRAMARALTERRGERATALAEATIEEAKAVFAAEALEAGLIDFVASDEADLLRTIDGFTVEVLGREVTLRTGGAQVEALQLSWFEQLLNRVIDPNILAILLFIGVQSILIELSNPGGWVAGFIGVVCLALALYGLGVIPVNWFGLALIAIAFVLFLVDLAAPTHGALTITAALTLIAGLLVLFSAPGVEEFGRLSLPLVVGLGVGAALFFGFVVLKGLRAQRAKPVTGGENLIGAVGVARGDLKPEGFVVVQGERWRAIAEDGEVAEGARVQVIARDGFRLRVRPAQE
jgi:membrane-bound serine protease (ClpP class)